MANSLIKIGTIKKNRTLEQYACTKSGLFWARAFIKKQILSCSFQRHSYFIVSLQMRLTQTLHVKNKKINTYLKRICMVRHKALSNRSSLLASFDSVGYAHRLYFFFFWRVGQQRKEGPSKVYLQ